jgi:hypothetical protein
MNLLKEESQDLIRHEGHYVFQNDFFFRIIQSVLASDTAGNVVTAFKTFYLEKFGDLSFYFLKNIS